MRIGLIGAGNIGSALARHAVDSGHEVVISNSRGPETLTRLVGELGDSARAGTPAEAAAAGDVVVVTIPLKNYRQVPVDELAGKTVIDTNNYYPQRDGRVAELDDGSATTAGLLQAHLPTSHVVKAFNNITAGDLATAGKPQSTRGRRALPLAGDDVDAKKVVAGLIEEFGFEAVDAGPLPEGRRFERDKPAYLVALDAAGLRSALARG
ncbi:MAG: 8-hydroxy-5-deazaflavin:NADPH oxidoreductase [Actinomycetota bacterium]|jgi:predicted dinucleotide-binding enzyme|nr:8-hydroxy-5-deazaflavin:NADPH oxidoreductase [Actinomycetota bacterium]